MMPVCELNVIRWTVTFPRGICLMDVRAVKKQGRQDDHRHAPRWDLVKPRGDSCTICTIRPVRIVQDLLILALPEALCCRT